MQPRFQINLLKFLLQKETRFCSHTQNKMQQAKTTKSQPTILSFTFLQACSWVQQNFCLTPVSSYSLKTSFVTMFADTQCPKAKLNMSKIKIYTGVNSYRTEIKWHGASRLISFSFTLQKDTRTCNRVQKSKYSKKNHKGMSNVYSISVNPDTFSFSHWMGPRSIFLDCRVTYSLKTKGQNW